MAFVKGDKHRWGSGWDDSASVEYSFSGLIIIANFQTGLVWKFQTLGINGDFVATPEAALSWSHREPLLLQVDSYHHSPSWETTPGDSETWAWHHLPGGGIYETYYFWFDLLIIQSNMANYPFEHRLTAFHSSGHTFPLQVFLGPGSRNHPRLVLSLRWSLSTMVISSDPFIMDWCNHCEHDKGEWNENFVYSTKHFPLPG